MVKLAGSTGIGRHGAGWRIVRARPVRIAAFALTVALALGGCAGDRMDVFAPEGRSIPDAGRVDMLVATTRARADDPATLFNGERGDKLALADIAISIPPASARKVGEVQWPTAVPGNPATDFVVLKVADLDERTARTRLRERLKRQGHGRVLLFVHGYNNRFADAVFRFAQISHDSAAPSLPVLFTWPSRAKTLAYAYDRESANFSRDALELAIRALALEPAVTEIDVLAHSMGTWVTLESLRQIAIRDGRLPPKVKNVMIAAPDVDIDVFGMQIARMGKPRPRFTLFTSQDDRALAFSQRIGGNIPRLGQIDASEEPLRSALAAQGVETIDLTKLRAGDSFNHAKFAQSPMVVQFIGERLKQGQTVSDSKTSLGESIETAAATVGSSVGSIAALVVTAPVAALDEGSRRSFGSQLADALGAIDSPSRTELQLRRLERERAPAAAR